MVPQVAVRRDLCSTPRERHRSASTPTCGTLPLSHVCECPGKRARVGATPRVALLSEAFEETPLTPALSPAYGGEGASMRSRLNPAPSPAPSAGTPWG